MRWPGAQKWAHLGGTVGRGRGRKDEIRGTRVIAIVGKDECCRVRRSMWVVRVEMRGQDVHDNGGGLVSRMCIVVC